MLIGEIISLLYVTKTPGSLEVTTTTKVKK